MTAVPYIVPTADPVTLVEAKLHLRVDHTADDELIQSILNAASEWCEKYEGQSYTVRSWRVYLDYFPASIMLSYPPILSVDSIQYYDAGGELQTLDSSVYIVDTDTWPGLVYPAYNQFWPMTRLEPKSVIVTYTAGYSTFFTANATTDVLTAGNAVFSDGDKVRVTTDQGDLPAPLEAKKDYYVRDASGAGLKLALTVGGTAIDITDTGTGTHYLSFADRGPVPDRVKAAIKLLTSHLYEHRLAVCSENYSEVPMAVKSLLMERVWSA